MNTAVDDGLIKRNTCRIKGAGSEDSPERPVLSVAQVYAMADAVGLRYRALILLAAFYSLRWGELAALRPEDINLDACTVRVTRQLNKPGAVPVFVPPQSRAGRRVVDFADLIVPDLRQHLGAVPPSALAFTSPEGTALSNTNFRRRVWGPAVAASTFTICAIPASSSRPMRVRISRTHGPDGARPRARRADLPALV
jgi:integrase